MKPTSGASFVLSKTTTTVTIEAAASDPDDGVASVEFYVGSVVLGVRTAAPYRIDWSPSIPGNYSLTARAIDRGGKATTSAPVRIQVKRK